MGFGGVGACKVYLRLPSTQSKLHEIRQPQALFHLAVQKTTEHPNDINLAHF